jgi:membrane protein required for colicin V production
MTAFDLIAVLVLLVSAGIGFFRGGAREVVTLLAFALAAAIAVFGLRFTGPLAQKALHPALLADAAAVVVIFVIAYALLWIAGRALMRGIRETEMLSGLDRAAGVGFGLLRGLVLLGVFYLLINIATPPERAPHWIKGAALYPLSGAAGHMLMALAPKGQAMAGKMAPALARALKDGASDRSAGSSRGSGYDEQSRRSVDDLVERTR